MEEHNNGSASQHRYLIVENDIREKIVSGELRDGDRLPKEAELCERYGVSRITIRRAIQNLADENLLYKLRGRGTFISSSHYLLQKKPGINFGLSALSRSGYLTTKKMLSCGLVAAPEDVADHLDIRAGRPVQCIRRLLLIDSAPQAIDTVYATQDRLPDLIDLLSGGASLFDLLERHYDIPIKIDALTLHAATATPEESRLLLYVTGAPTFILDHVTQSSGERAVTYSKTTWRADDVSFHFKMTEDGLIL